MRQTRATETPRWEERTGCLWIGLVLVKRVRHDAAHQRLVLGRFQDGEWTEFLNDPCRLTGAGTARRACGARSKG